MKYAWCKIGNMKEVNPATCVQIKTRTTTSLMILASDQDLVDI